MRFLSSFSAVTALLLLCAGDSFAGGRVFVAGPVSATVLRVIDGDTILVRATPWPQQSIEVSVRLRGIDAPEMRSSCASERQAARAARVALNAMAPENSRIELSRISGDKYFGRVLADVRLVDGGDPAEALLETGHARPYQGGHRSRPACF